MTARGGEMQIWYVGTWLVPCLLHTRGSLGWALLGPCLSTSAPANAARCLFWPRSIAEDEVGLAPRALREGPRIVTIKTSCKPQMGHRRDDSRAVGLAVIQSVARVAQRLQTNFTHSSELLRASRSQHGRTRRIRQGSRPSPSRLGCPRPCRSSSALAPVPAQ